MLLPRSDFWKNRDDHVAQYFGRARQKVGILLKISSKSDRLLRSCVTLKFGDAVRCVSTALWLLSATVEMDLLGSFCSANVGPSPVIGECHRANHVFMWERNDAFFRAGAKMVPLNQNLISYKVLRIANFIGIRCWFFLGSWEICELEKCGVYKTSLGRSLI